MIDYGLAKRYIDLETKAHITFRKGLKLLGTPRFCSLNSQKGYELSRRDDLEGLGFCLIYMLKGSLPWQGIRDYTKETRNNKIIKLKKDLSDGNLFKGLPSELVHYIKYCRDLNFEEEPSYSRLHSLLSEVFRNTSCFKAFSYDWILVQFKPKKQSLKDSINSDKTEFEDISRVPKRSISRLLAIKNLIADPNALNSSPFEESKKERAGPYEMGSTVLSALNLSKTNNIRSSSLCSINNPVNKTLQGFIKVHPELIQKGRRLIGLSKFPPKGTTEHFNGKVIDETIPSEREYNEHLELPSSQHFHCSLTNIKNKKFTINENFKRTNTELNTKKNIKAIKTHTFNLNN